MFWFVPTWHNVESTYQIASVETWESWGLGKKMMVSVWVYMDGFGYVGLDLWK